MRNLGKVTLSDLFNRLDWSTVRDNPDRWYKLYTTVEDKPLVDEGYFCRFWCNAIHCAFYGQDEMLQKTATQLLLRVEMWDKVVEQLKKEGLLIGKEIHELPEEAASGSSATI